MHLRYIFLSMKYYVSLKFPNIRQVSILKHAEIHVQ